jgi:signal transduction histidine kinase
MTIHISHDPNHPSLEGLSGTAKLDRVGPNAIQHTPMKTRTTRQIPKAWRSFAFFLLCLGVNLQGVGRADAALTNAADVLGLSAKQAPFGGPVLVKGIVTAAEPTWRARFFVQDSSGGIFVDDKGTNQPLLGDVVEVSGLSSPGGYAPVIRKPLWKKVGSALLPEAKPVTIERLMSGAEDSQRVEISGIVRTAQASTNRIGIELASGGYRVPAYFPLVPNADPQSLVGAKVLLRGTAAVAFNAPLRRFLTVTLFVPRLEDFIITEPAPTNLFHQPLTLLNGIAQYRKDTSPGNQVHVKGVVTYQREGQDLFLQDETGGLQVKSKLNQAVYPGETVEAVGFPAVENFLPVLEDAVFRKTTEPLVKLKPKTVTLAQMQEGRHHADLVTLRGRLIDRLITGTGRGAAGPDIQTALVLQSTNFIFVAEKDQSEHNTFLNGIPIGSQVAVNGICLLESSDDGKVIKSFRLLIPTSHDIRVVAKPSWLTPQHLLISLTLVFVVLFAAIGWIVMVAKKNSMLKSLVHEKETAQGQLQQAHDQLEERVRERTAQLKIEMTSRKESEVQFRAVLTERTRLAQELHDTLEQTMTGVALQLDIVGDQLGKAPDGASQHLKLARGLMRRSQVDLRRSVWGLRSRTEEEFNLAGALINSGRQITDDTGIRVEVETVGQPGPLSEIVEENLLRIGQEAVTNAVKHSGAALVKIELQFSPQKIVLQIVDDGKGFDPQVCAGPKEGHFGILGIRERTERLSGQLLITSTPSMGTSIRVEIPVSPTNGDHSVQPANQDHEERV